jgi:hypothetical protein
MVTATEKRRRRLHRITNAVSIFIASAAIIGRSAAIGAEPPTRNDQSVTVPGTNNNVGASKNQSGGETAGTINKNRTYITIKRSCVFIGTDGQVTTIGCSTKLRAAPQDTGLLTPSNYPVPKYAAKCIPDGAYAVILGRTIAYSQRPFLPGSGILNLHGEIVLAIDPTGANIVISILQIYDQAGRVIVHVDRNGFWVAPSAARAIRPDPSTLIVYDNTDTEILNLRVLNAKTITLTGIFRHPGLNGPVLIQPWPGDAEDFGLCTSSAGGSAIGIW